MMHDTPHISVVIPARDEIVAIGPLVEDVGRILEGREFEVIVIDDGSRDGTRHALAGLAAKHWWMTWLSNGTPIGQSASIRLGVKASCGELIVTLDGDGQNPADQIPLLLAPFEQMGSGDLGLVQGQRQDRQDGPGKRWASVVANAIAQ